MKEVGLRSSEITAVIYVFKMDLPASPSKGHKSI